MGEMAMFDSKTRRLSPEKDGPIWVLKAYPSITSMGVSQNKGLLQLPGRRGVTISTGVKVTVPEGWKFCFTTHEQFAQRGGAIINSGHITEGDVFVTIYNVGAAIIPIKEGDILAKAWFEPIHDILVGVTSPQ